MIKTTKLPSPSKRLRNVIFIKWQQTYNAAPERLKMPFEDFYNLRMEQLIIQEKSYLYENENSQN